MQTWQNKATKNKYTTLDDMKSDLYLMVANAKTYNLEESQVYQDAMEIQVKETNGRYDGMYHWLWTVFLLI